MELAHVELASGDSGVGSVGVPINIHGAHTADTLAAVVVERDGVFVLADELLVEDVNHLQERSPLEDVF